MLLAFASTLSQSLWQLLLEKFVIIGSLLQIIRQLLKNATFRKMVTLCKTTDKATLVPSIH